jgi:hypothetical protein
MEKEFIPYEQALALKELGFDEWCYNVYEKDGRLCNTYESTRWQNENPELITRAPLYQQTFRWFREKYNIECYVNCYWSEEDSSKRDYYANYNYGSDVFFTIDKNFKSHEEAELECLKKLIEIVKNK